MYNYILEKLPYKSSFRFIDNISELNENGITGDYTLRKDAFFYEDHFPGQPITPGVILTEIMAQIGLVILGIYIMNATENSDENQIGILFPLLTSTDVSFYKIVLPGQKVTVISKKEYFRFNKLKCNIQMFDESNELVAKGIFAGIIGKVKLKS
jgi:3-hydroxyacyl-[acyl-carrier-protein] dehydratase